MKHFISFVFLLFFFAGLFAAPTTVQGATFVVNTVTPTSGEAGSRVTVTITGGAFITPPFASIGPSHNPGDDPNNQVLGTVQSFTSTQAVIRFDIPNDTALLGNFPIQVCLGGYGPPEQNTTDCDKSKSFRITAIGGGGGGGGGDFGGGGVEPVPADYGGIPAGPGTGDDFVNLIEGIINWVFVILLIVAIIFILLAGFQFITGGGEPQAVAQARMKLFWAAVGIAVALLARGIPFVIRNIISG